MILAQSTAAASDVHVVRQPQEWRPPRCRSCPPFLQVISCTLLFFTLICLDAAACLYGATVTCDESIAQDGFGVPAIRSPGHHASGLAGQGGSRCLVTPNSNLQPLIESCYSDREPCHPASGHSRERGDGIGHKHSQQTLGGE